MKFPFTLELIRPNRKWFKSSGSDFSKNNEIRRLKAISGRRLAIGMKVQVVPRIFEETEDIGVYYTVETPGTTWSKAPLAHLG